ncbi:rubredoxin-like domain-containing protein [Acetobacterium sp. KB-1]|jgi:rubrerythrin|uniref:rubredoxin-like domain-containing protein n=1 Tax=Acetobacterium sp. KB-1 TaxID=2184575 RepID=UPI00352A429C
MSLKVYTRINYYRYFLIKVVIFKIWSRYSISHNKTYKKKCKWRVINKKLWKCRVCGYKIEGVEAPELCSNCRFPWDQFAAQSEKM